jgi:hypothetical protein
MDAIASHLFEIGTIGLFVSIKIKAVDQMATMI